MGNKTGIGSIIEYLGVRYVVYKVNKECYACINGYDFTKTNIDRNKRVIKKVSDCDYDTITGIRGAMTKIFIEKQMEKMKL